ncbi:MAG: hypothetical protein ACOCRX_01290 [Candidatus Woesearchaeota archaeon]
MKIYGLYNEDSGVIYRIKTNHKQIATEEFKKWCSENNYNFNDYKIIILDADGNINFKTNTYYDAFCSICGKATSTDYDFGFMKNKDDMKYIMEREGWRIRKGKNICPKCLKKN